MFALIMEMIVNTPYEWLICVEPADGLFNPLADLDTSRIDYL